MGFFLTTNITRDKLEELFASYKRGRFIGNLFGKFNDKHIKSEAGMKQAIASKFKGHLSRRKYNFSCKIQNKVFGVEKQKWDVAITYGDYNINLKTCSISNESVQKCVKSLDIGDVNVIPEISGAARTVTGLTYLIIDLNLKVKALRDQLIWFSDIHNHFIFQFSDDGAPESRETTMSIGSLTLWNIVQRVRSRESVPEKHEICRLLWKQHSEEMLLLEGNIFFVNEEKCTVQFQPSSDQAWQVWANNVLPASATYPSPFANVHKTELTERGGSIGVTDDNRWKVPTMDSRLKEINAINKFKSELKSTLKPACKHAKVLEFLAANGFRQLGNPIIGSYCDLQRPGPIHLEINAWQHMLDLMYKEAVRSGLFETFVQTIKKPNL